MLYPLKFHPILKETPWGGARLSANNDARARIGESWQLSAVKGHASVVANGPLAGETLVQLVETHAGNLVGGKIYERFGNEFPVLLKFIDAREDLSIQVHPDDDTAMQRHHSRGKTEMWFVIEADEGASLLIGFKEPISRTAFTERLAAGRLTDILRVERTRAGDCFFIPAGTLHAIRAGCFIAEIQETSDVTYRVYDYDRVDSMGQKRALHAELAAGVINYGGSPETRVAYVPRDDDSTLLVACPHFTTELLLLRSVVTRDYTRLDSFVAYMCLSGSFVINDTANSPVHVFCGESVLVPATLKRLSLTPLLPSNILEIFID